MGATDSEEALSKKVSEGLQRLAKSPLTRTLEEYKKGLQNKDIKEEKDELFDNSK